VNPCNICKTDSWEKAYQGPIRLGKPDNISTEHHIVWECRKCEVLRLSLEVNEGYYKGNEYQAEINNSTKVQTNWAVLDEDLEINLQSTSLGFYRNKVVVDVGAGHGYFIDAIKGFAKEVIGIEPNDTLRKKLQDKGHNCYDSIENLSKNGQSIDIICSHNVIEHVADPAEFILAQKAVLAPNGKLIVTTPNLNNFLMNFGPVEYKSFFFRKAHLWYFNSDSLKFVMEQVGLKKIEFKFQQRFGLSNTLLWMRDKKAPGKLNCVNDEMCDSSWRHFLEKTQQTEHVFCICE